MDNQCPMSQQECTYNLLHAQPECVVWPITTICAIITMINFIQEIADFVTASVMQKLQKIIQSQKVQTLNAKD